MIHFWVHLHIHTYNGLFPCVVYDIKSTPLLMCMQRTLPQKHTHRANNKHEFIGRKLAALLRIWMHFFFQNIFSGYPLLVPYLAWFLSLFWESIPQIFGTILQREHVTRIKMSRHWAIHYVPEWGFFILRPKIDILHLLFGGFPKFGSYFKSLALKFKI